MRCVFSAEARPGAETHRLEGEASKAYSPRHFKKEKEKEMGIRRLSKISLSDINEFSTAVYLRHVH